MLASWSSLCLHSQPPGRQGQALIPRQMGTEAQCPGSPQEACGRAGSWTQLGWGPPAHPPGRTLGNISRSQTNLCEMPGKGLGVGTPQHSITPLPHGNSHPTLSSVSCVHTGLLLLPSPLNGCGGGKAAEHGAASPAAVGREAGWPSGQGTAWDSGEWEQVPAL